MESIKEYQNKLVNIKKEEIELKNKIKELENKLGIYIWYIAVGKYTGSLHNLGITWDHYKYKGTKEEVQKIFARLYLKYNNINQSFRECVSKYMQHIELLDEDKIADDELIKVYLDNMHFDKTETEYNLGYKILEDLSDEQLAKDIVNKEILWIFEDTNFTFDKVY